MLGRQQRHGGENGGAGIWEFGDHGGSLTSVRPCGIKKDVDFKDKTLISVHLNDQL